MSYDTKTSKEKLADSRERLANALQRLDKNIDKICAKTQKETMLRKDVVDDLSKQIDLLDGFIKQNKAS